MKILLAEDMESLNRAIAAMLRHAEYEVDTVYDGEQAVDRLRGGHYDTAVLDIMMPRKTGLEVLSEMRRNHDTTPVLLLTALSGIDDRVKGLEAGADDYLSKPFAMKELLARVQALCRRAGGFETDGISFRDMSLDPINLEISAVNSVSISARECSLLQLLLSNKGRVLETDYLLSRVWTDDPKSSPTTLQLYVSYVRNKIHYIDSCVKITGDLTVGFKIE